jgi:hypothetical protein
MDSVSSSQANFAAFQKNTMTGTFSHPGLSSGLEELDEVADLATTG